MIQVYEFSFGQVIHVDAIHIRFLPGGQHSVRDDLVIREPLPQRALNIWLGSFDEEIGIIRPELKASKPAEPCGKQEF